MSMIRKYHNHKLQTNPWHREEEPHKNHETPGRQTKQSNPLSLPHRKTRMDTKYRTTKHRTITETHNGSNNQQRINSNRTTALEWTAARATGGLNAFYWYQIFAILISGTFCFSILVCFIVVNGDIFVMNYFKRLISYFS